MYTEELIIKLLWKINGKYPDTKDMNLRTIIEDVLYDYEVGPKTTALAIRSDMFELAKLYVACKDQDGLSPQTLKRYAQHLVKFCSFFQKNVIDIDEMDIRKYLAAYSADSRIKKSTLAGEISILKTFFKWLQNHRYIQYDPCANIQNTKIGKHLRKSLTTMEIEKIRMACKNPRERALVEVFYGTGCRLSEVLELNIEDLEYRSNSIQVNGKGDKDRIVMFNDVCSLYIKQYLLSRGNPQTGPLFITSKRPFNRLGKRSMQTDIKKISRRVGLDKATSLHILRHSYATIALKRGVPITTIQKLLGHSNLETTMIYAEVDDSTIRADYQKHMA